METVTSKDGTTIAYDKTGQGPAIILVDGAFGHRGFFGLDGVAALLAPNFTAITYDRRGRNDSGDTPPYAIEREVEDIQALIDAAGGLAYVYGISSGAVLAVYAAAMLPAITKLAMYDPPLTVFNDRRKPIPKDYLDHLKALIAADKRGDAVKYVMSVVMGVPGIFVFIAQLMPVWKPLKSVAHTAIYDMTIMGDFTVSAALSKAMAAIQSPTLVMAGGASPSWFQHAAQAVAEGIPGARLKMLDRQTHEVAPKAIAPALAEFFNSNAAIR